MLAQREVPLQAQAWLPSLGNTAGSGNLTCFSESSCGASDSAGPRCCLCKENPSSAELEVLAIEMTLAGLLLPVLCRLPLCMQYPLAEVPLVPWLWCGFWLTFLFVLFLYAVVMAARITTTSLTHSCIHFKFWQSFWSLQLLKISSVMWECKFYLYMF